MKSSEDLTLLVFKGNSTARTFQVPLNWISKLGFLAGIVVAVAVLGCFFSLRNYLAMRQALQTANPAYVQDLEQEIASLRTTKAQLQVQIQNQSQNPTNPPVASSVSTGGAPSAPAPTVTITMTPTANVGAAAGSSLAFSALPANVQAPPPANESSISIYDPHVSWKGRTLNVQFFIQYVKEDKGNQQGRIVLLARGGDTVLAYPSGVLNFDQSSPLVAPEKGEYFSVSRIREVKAEFGPMKSNTALKNVEVFLFGNDGRLLVHQLLAPGTPAGKPANAPTTEEAS